MGTEPIGLVDFPDELLLLLFQYLNVNDVIALSRVCKFFWKFCEDDVVWKATFKGPCKHLQSLTWDLLTEAGRDLSQGCKWKYLAVHNQSAYDCGISGPVEIVPSQASVRRRGRYSEMLFARYGESETLASVAGLDSACTVELWFQCDISGANESLAGIILGAQSEGVSRSIWPQYHWQLLHIGPDGHIRGSILTYCLMKGPYVADGRWHHVAISGDFKGQRLYIDGFLADSSEKCFGSESHQKELRYCQLGTGCISYGYNTPYGEDAMPPGHCGPLPFKGKIKELRIWKKACTKENISSRRFTPRIDMYLQTEDQGSSEDLAYYWPLSRLLSLSESHNTSLGSKKDYCLKALNVKALDGSVIETAY